MAWRIKLLGDIRVSYGHREITRFESRKVVALIACLALAPDRIRVREELAALLWPDAERRLGLERLRHVLSSLLRQLTPPGESHTVPLFIANRHGIRLNTAEVSSDVAGFKAQIRKRDWQKAIALYTGDLLPGYYDDWIQEARESLSALYSTALEKVGDAPDLAEDRAVLSEPVAISHRLLVPNYLTTFFGRQAEREQLRTLLQTRRLVTLFGPGGCGKTRLAAEVSREIASAFEGTVFVSLTDCIFPDQIPDRIRAVLQLPGGESAMEQIIIALHDTPTLLVLDNMEQMSTEGAAEIVEILLARLPQMHCLLTSRMLLHIAGEQTFPLSPLPLPTDEQITTTNPCVRLFIDRAQMARPDFALNARNQEDLFALCSALEGIPLALELCASRIRAHSLGEMRRQVEEGKRFALVARREGIGRKEVRHGSLHAALLWSWRLLPARMQDFLAALSTLRGRFRAETAAVVCDAPDSPILLEELVDCSLVQTQYETLPDGEETFFFLLESVREFATEHLPLPRQYALRRAHAAHLLARAQNPATAQKMAWEDLAHLQGAVEDAIIDEATDEALALCTALREVWYSMGSTTAALVFLERALALSPGDRAIRAEALASGVYLALNHADFTRAAKFAQEAKESAGKTTSALAAAHTAQCHLMYRRNDAPELIRTAVADAVVLAQNAERRNLEANLETTMGMLANRNKDFEEAERYLSAAEALWQSLGEEHRAYGIRFKRAVIATDRGNLELARQYYEECRVVARRENDQKTEASIYGNMGLLLTQEERWDEAIQTIQEGLRRSYALGNLFSVHVGMWNLAEPLAYTGRGAEAATVFAWGQQCWLEGGAVLNEEEQAYRDRVLTKARESLPPPETDLEPYLKRGTRFSLQDAVHFALNL